MRPDLRRTLTAVCAALLVCGCGDYSNSDVLFFSALPSREDIKSNLPEDPAAAPAPASEVVERAVRAAIAADVPALGNRARLYDDTREAAQLFTAIAEAFVGLVDEVQRHRPTTRSAEERVWGPFEIRNTGHEAKVTISRVLPNVYTYSFVLRPEGTGDDAFVEFIGGEFRASGAAREGAGEFHLDNRVLIDAGLTGDDGGLRNVDWVHLTYDTLSSPKTVTMAFTALLDTLQFDHAEYEDGSGSMRFTYDDAFSATYRVNSRWLGSGAGRADANVSVFLGGEGTVSQCWDDAFRLTFHQSDFEDPRLLGDVSGCPVGLPE